MDGALERRRDRLVLLGRLGARREPRVLFAVGHVGGDPVGHLAGDRQDRPLGRLPHRGVGPVGRIGQRRTDQRRIDQLTGPGDELLGGAADQLGEDHPGVPPRPQQGRSGDRLDDLLAAYLIDRAVLAAAQEAVELVQHGAQRQRHVVTRVAVGNREHVEVVDLLSARFQVNQRARDSRPKADQIRIRHGHSPITSDPDCERPPPQRRSSVHPLGPPPTIPRDRKRSSGSKSGPTRA